MASTARAEADCKEFYDDPKTLQAKIRRLAALVRGSKHFCAFTGAGISTAAGIADYRSGINTKLDTGAGKWAREAAVETGKASQIKKAKRKTKAIKAIPTKSHMALVALMTQGPKYLKHLVSQNTDGLHRRSGIPVHQLSELHGNGTLEVCNKCSRGYIRDFRTVCASKTNKKRSKHDKRTGRMCTVPQCGGALCRTVVNFGQSLPELTWEAAQDNADACDVMLSLGSSLTVTPAADLCAQIGEAFVNEILVNQYDPNANRTPKHHLVVVNLQKTPMDNICSLRIFAKIDDVMVGLMRELSMPIPEWRLQRLLKVAVAPIDGRDDAKSLTVSAIDVDGITATVFKQPRLSNNGRQINAKGQEAVLPRLRNPDVFVFQIPSDLNKNDEAEDDEDAEVKTEDAQNQGDGARRREPSPVRRRPSDDESESPNSKASAKIAQLVAEGFSEDEARAAIQMSEQKADEAKDDSGLVLDLGFYGHYGEPRLSIRLNECVDALGEEGGEAVYRLTMDIASKQWTAQSIDFEPLPTVKDTYSFSVKKKKAKK